MRRLVTRARVGRLATVRADGRAHLVPVCFALLGEVVYSAVDDKPKRHTRLQRLANVTATGTASLLVDEYDEDWTRLWWVRLDGSARVLENRDKGRRAIEALRAKYPQYAGHPPAGAVLAMTVESWVGWAAAA